MRKVNTFALVMVFTIGLVVGSFLNVCIYRIPQGLSIVTPPSRCGSCNKELKVLDLIPVLSYLFLRGKCRFCGSKISIRYPLVELFCGIGFLVLFLKFGFSMEYLKYVILFSGLVVCSMIDFDHKIIPDSVLVVLTAAVLPILVIQSIESLISGIIGFLLGGGLLFIIALLSKGGMGGGDVKFAAVLGLYLGWQKILLVFFIAFVAGSIFGLMWAFIKKKSLKSAIPFGPFLSAAAVVSIFYGEKIINWYLGLY